MRKLIIIAFIVVASIPLTIFHQRAMRLVHPDRLPIHQTPADFGIESWEEVKLTDVDNINLNGWYMPPQSKQDTVIFIHGLASNRTAMLPQVAMLTKHGYGALLLDLRGHGESGGAQSSWGEWETEDVKTAVSHLQSLPETTGIHLIGHSMGGAIAIRAATQLPQIKSLVVESSYTRLRDNSERLAPSFCRLPEWMGSIALGWAKIASGNWNEIEPIVEVSQVTQPILFTHGLADGTIWSQNSQQLYETAVSPKQIHYIPYADHTNFPTANPTVFEQTLLQFLAQTTSNESQAHPPK